VSIKRKDTPEARAFWKFVEDTALSVRLNSPAWATCVECGERYEDHVTRWACVLKPGVTPREDYDQP
jgi:hypothetical protein